MADQRILSTEKMVGAGHATLADTLNRLALVEHNNDGTHKGIGKLFAVQHAPISHTGNTAETTLFSVNIPGGTLGANGRIRINGFLLNTNSANAKWWYLRFGGTLFSGAGLTTTDCAAFFHVGIWNENSTNAQAGNPFFHVINNPANVRTGAVDTTQDQSLAISVQLANAGETATLRGVAVEILKP